MALYRCYLMNLGMIENVEIIEAETDEDAILVSKEVFVEKESRFSSYEVWDRARVVHRFRK
jgi:hypothetical protein